MKMYHVNVVSNEQV